MLRLGLPKLCRLCHDLCVRSIVTGPIPNVEITTGPYLDFALETVDLYADRPALIDGLTGETIRYSELKTLTGRVASGFAKRGFGKNHTISLFASNCWEAVIAYHGVLATGGNMNLINCHSTTFELCGHLRQTRPRFMLVTSQYASTAIEAAREIGGVETIYVIGKGEVPHGCQHFDELLNDNGSANPWGCVDINGEDVALLPHSSGTSGFPKTVMLTHNNARANIHQGEPLFNHRPGEEVMLACLPFYHIYSPIIVYGFGLRSGASVVILPSFEPHSMLRSIEQYKVTYLHLVPPLILFLTNSDLVNQYDLSSARCSFCAAAPLHPDTHREFVKKYREQQPEFDLCQGYGMTELSPLTHVTPKKEVRPGDKLGTVGVPLPNTEVRVLKYGSDEDAGVGEEGEIVIRGPQIMKGYLNNPGETNELIRNGWVHTGDIGYHDEDNYFYVTDRVKELIKCKGIQIAPAELEALLLLHPAVADCGVVGKKDDRAGEVPMAFVVRSKSVEEKDLVDFVAEKLSREKQLQGGVVFVEEIPKSASGKILRRVLREKLNEL